jgi:hypothetical protein
MVKNLSVCLVACVVAFCGGMLVERHQNRFVSASDCADVCDILEESGFSLVASDGHIVTDLTFGDNPDRGIDLDWQTADLVAVVE